MNARLYIQRHGTTPKNSDNVYRGLCNDPTAQLTPEGAKEIQTNAKRLKTCGIKQIFTDDLSRTLESAQLAAKILGVREIHSDQRLRPLDIGIFQGKPKQQYHDELMKYYADPTLVIPDGERVRGFTHRVLQGVDAVLEYIETTGNSALLSTHGSVADALVHLYNGVPYCYESPIAPSELMVLMCNKLWMAAR